MDIFWKLSAGAKFDMKRFRSDSQKLKISKGPSRDTVGDAAHTGLELSQEKVAMENDQAGLIDIQKTIKGEVTLNSSILELQQSLNNGQAVASFEKLYRQKKGMTVSSAKMADNKARNRYCDILPYDQTMVKLSSKHQYINASYINMSVTNSAQGGKTIYHYIATQGPLPTTAVDFWQMVWQEKTTNIIMLTAENEKGVIKCHRYRPVSVGESVSFGNIKVVLCEMKESPSAVFSRLLLSSSVDNFKDGRTIKHFQYLGWPDHGVPHQPSDFLHFIRDVRLQCSEFAEPEPTVVHCSAGIGRTGVFIGLNTAMHFMAVNKPFSVIDIVKQMRDQRAGCIQTPDQFRFMCEAILLVYNEQLNSNNSSGNMQTPDDDSENDDTSTDEDDSEHSLSDENEADSDSDCSANSTDRTAVGTAHHSDVTLKKSVLELEKQKPRRKKKTLTAERLAQIHQEEVNHFRNVNHMHVYGSDVPEPIKTFDDLQAAFGVHQKIIDNLKSMSFHEPTAIEMQAIPVMMHCRELMACAPTGSGKTLAFALPLLHHLKGPENGGLRGLVLAPTRELAEQICHEFNRIGNGLGLRIRFFHNTGSDLQKSSKKAFSKADILVTTPNRLVYLLQQDPSLSLSSVKWLVIDESDKLFEEGKTGFREQLATVYKACDSKDIRRAMFSATFSYDVEEWCRLNLDNVVQVYIGVRNAVAQTIEQQLLYVGDESGKLIAIRDIIRKGFQPPVLVFVQSKERAKDLFHELQYDGIRIDAIHADRTQSQRDSVVYGFRTGTIWMLICTDVMCRGMDFKGVNLVINYDFPNSDYVYIHRIGRTGRAGRPGKAITFFTDDDSVNLRCIATKMRDAGCEIPEYMLQIKAPNRKLKRKLEKSAVKREPIRTDAGLSVPKKKKFKKTSQKNVSNSGD